MHKKQALRHFLFRLRWNKQSSGSSSGSGRNNYNNMPPSGPMHHGNNWNQNRGNIDMPNLQSLGINPNGQNGPPNQGVVN